MHIKFLDGWKYDVHLILVEGNELNIILKLQNEWNGGVV